ncbi:MAG: lysophospholipid acyltransferase family protein [Campylobacteraceae bacterium]|nr:lysophospholipid acyltransferase family protein [Campylobacteraceae bacterium]
MAKSSFKDFKKALVLKIVPKVAFVFLNLLYFSCKKKFHSSGPKDKIQTPAIFAFWHGELLPLMKGYVDFRGTKSIDTIISSHFDGEIIAKIVAMYGGGSIRGSSTRGGLKALKESFRSLGLKRDLAITPDGPKGPRHSVADGIVLISKKKSVPIVTLNCKPSSYWQLNSWDKFMIPKPFSTLNIFIGEPFYLKDLSIEESKKLIKERLMQNAV